MTQYDRKSVLLQMSQCINIKARWVIPVVPRNTIYEYYSVIIKGQTIEDILPINSAEQRYPNATVINLDKHLLIPGLINAHCHMAMSLLKGFAEDQPLMNWLQQFIWPVEQQLVSSKFVADGSLLAMCEMLKSGTTTVADMYFFPEEVARLADAIGIRAQCSFPVLDFPSNWAPSGNYLEKGLALYDQYKHHPRINIAFGPHAPYTVSNDLFRKMIATIDELQAMVHIHCHESGYEIEESIKQYGIRPLERLVQLGLTGSHMQAVHMTQVTQKDIELLQKYCISVVHCPESNMKLASGTTPVQRMLDNDINVSIGTDGSASNNDLDILGELRSAALLAKVSSGDSTALPAHQLLEMVTVNGAKALGIDHLTGSLETGKQADLVAVNMDHLELQPIYNPLAQLIYNVKPNHIAYVWVAGNQLVNNGELQGVDTSNLHKRVDYWQQQIQSFNHDKL